MCDYVITYALLNFKGSWKSQLRNKFKNWRRGSNDRHEEGEEDNADDDTPASTTQVQTDSREELDDDANFENNKDLIVQEWDQAKPRLSVLKNLMDSTFKRQRDWINGTCPSALNVLATYPCLESGKMVSRLTPSCASSVFVCAVNN